MADDESIDDPRHFWFSAFRESMVEHLFIAELWKEAWRRGDLLDVMRAEVDASGYDVAVERVASSNGGLRHIQLKGTRSTSKTRQQTINVALARKPSGCVVWLEVSEGPDDISLSYRFFGNGPGEPLPDVTALKTAKHTKADSQGVKHERPAIKVVPRSKFVPIEDIATLYNRLFGT